MARCIELFTVHQDLCDFGAKLVMRARKFAALKHMRFRSIDVRKYFTFLIHLAKDGITTSFPRISLTASFNSSQFIILTVT